jgi:two-component system response regulator
MSNTARRSHGPHENLKNARSLLSAHESVRKDEKEMVLVMVDDDEDDCALVGAALSEAGFGGVLRCLQDGCEIMDYLQRKGRYQDPATAPLPDIILLDLNMPRMGGYEVLKQLKSDPFHKTIPVIVLTTSSDAEDVKASYELGANSYITKQSSFDGLRCAFETIREYWVDVATLPPKGETTVR